MCKIILGVRRNSSNLASRNETGRLPTLLFIFIQMFKFYKRCLNLPTDRLLYCAFKEDQDLFSIGYKSWYTNLTKIFKFMNISDSDA